MMPASRPPSSNTATQPKPFDVISTIASAIRAFAADARHAVAGVHDLPHMRELGPELAARMKGAEIERGEAAPLEQRDRQRIAQHELHRRRGGRGLEPVGAGLRRARHASGRRRPRGRACCRPRRSSRSAEWRSAWRKSRSPPVPPSRPTRRWPARRRRSAPCRGRRGSPRPDGRRRPARRSRRGSLRSCARYARICRCRSR